MRKSFFAGFVSLIIATVFIMGCLFTGCSQTEQAANSEYDPDKVITLWAFTEEIPTMVSLFLEENPDFEYKINTIIVSTIDLEYQQKVEQALAEGGENCPDIYCADAAFVRKFAAGDSADYAVPYEELGIDVDNKIKESEIAHYNVEIGTNNDGKIVALGYQSTGGCFIYRRSIAIDTWGTDDPEEIGRIIGANTGSWDAYFKAAEDLKLKGYSMISGDGDIWHAVENSSDTGWIVDGKLNIDPKREKFLDISKALYINDYSNKTEDWHQEWYDDMSGTGDREVFGFFGPAWLIKYQMMDNSGGTEPGQGTYGDWAVCEPPIGFFWGGTWVFANKNSDKKEAVGRIIEWITLDSSKNGLQYKLASGDFEDKGLSKDTVASGVVMKSADGSMDYLGGQNMYDYYVPANNYANGKNLTQYDEVINRYWREAVRAYSKGEITRDEAIKMFKNNVLSDENILVE